MDRNVDNRVAGNYPLRRQGAVLLGSAEQMDANNAKCLREAAMNCADQQSERVRGEQRQLRLKYRQGSWTAWKAVIWLSTWGVALGAANCFPQDAAPTSVGGPRSAEILSHNLYALPSARIAEATLQQPARFQLRSTPLATALENIASSYRISVWLDRRIDPGYLVTFQATGSNLQNALEQIALLAEAEMQLVENVVYIGPPGFANRLAAAAAELYNSMQLHGGPALKQPVQLRWDELTTPTELLQTTAAKARLGIGEQLPHDLLRGGQFQRPSTLATSLALICVGHEQACVLTGAQTIRLDRLRASERWSAHYPISEITSLQVQTLKRKLDAGAVQRVGEYWLVSGNALVHRSFGRAAAGRGGGRRRTPPATRGSETRLSGDIAGTVENVAKQLAQMQGLSITWDPSCTPSQRQRNVSFHVEKATFEQIVESFSRAAGLRIGLTKTEMSFMP